MHAHVLRSIDAPTTTTTTFDDDGILIAILSNHAIHTQRHIGFVCMYVWYAHTKTLLRFGRLYADENILYTYRRPIQLCIQLWLSLFNTHNYQAIVMIIGFTSSIVCRACYSPFVSIADVVLYIFIWSATNCDLFCYMTKIYLQSFHYTLKMDEASCRCCVDFFFCISLPWPCTVHCIVAQSLTFSTINCILIFIRIFSVCVWCGMCLGWFRISLFYHYLVNGIM